jgi:hypothetical protein
LKLEKSFVISELFEIAGRGKTKKCRIHSYAHAIVCFFGLFLIEDERTKNLPVGSINCLTFVMECANLPIKTSFGEDFYGRKSLELRGEYSKEKPERIFEASLGGKLAFNNSHDLLSPSYQVSKIHNKLPPQPVCPQSLSFN